MLFLWLQRSVVGQRGPVDTTETEEHAMAVASMSKKNYRLYQRMNHGINKRKQEVSALDTKRRKLKNPEQAEQEAEGSKKKKTKKKAKLSR